MCCRHLKVVGGEGGCSNQDDVHRNSTEVVGLLLMGNYLPLGYVPTNDVILWGAVFAVNIILCLVEM